MGKRKHKVLIYQGGNYSGNYWEWNWCLWDSNGEWHKGFSSGSNGIDNEAMAKEVATVAEGIMSGKIGFFEYLKNGKHCDQISDDMAILDYSKKKDCDTLGEWACNITQGIVRYLEEIDEDHKIFVTCNRCGFRSQDLEDFNVDDMRSQGTATWYTSFVCVGCKNKSSCMECNHDFFGMEEALVRDGQKGQFCLDCYKKKINDLVDAMKLIVAVDIPRAIEYKKKIEMMRELLEKQVANGVTEPEPEPVEDLLKNDTTPFLPLISGKECVA